MQVLAKALESNHHVTHLNLEWCLIEVEGIKVGEPGVGSGFRCRSAIRLLQLKLYLRFFRLFGFTAPTLPPLQVVFSIQGDISSLKTI